MNPYSPPETPPSRPKKDKYWLWSPYIIADLALFYEVLIGVLIFLVGGTTVRHWWDNTQKSFFDLSFVEYCYYGVCIVVAITSKSISVWMLKRNETALNILKEECSSRYDPWS